MLKKIGAKYFVKKYFYKINKNRMKDRISNTKDVPLCLFFVFLPNLSNKKDNFLTDFVQNLS